MSAERDESPVPRPREAQEIDLEMVDDGTGPVSTGVPPGGSASFQDFMKMGPDMVGKVLRNLMMEKLKKWFLRNLVVFTVLSLVSMEFKWVRWILGFWAFIAGIQLAVLVLGWYLSGKQADKLAHLMRGMGTQGSGRDVP
jgi:hypothetical protein